VIEKIISGGQTGVDRAGLDVAIVLGIPDGGWCPMAPSRLSTRSRKRLRWITSNALDGTCVTLTGH